MKLTSEHVRFEIHELPRDFYGPRFSVIDVRRVIGLASGRVGVMSVQVGTLQTTRSQAERLMDRAILDRGIRAIDVYLARSK